VTLLQLVEVASQFGLSICLGGDFTESCTSIMTGQSAGLAGVSSGMGLDDGLLVCTLLLLI